MELQDIQNQWNAMETRLESLEIIQKNQIMEMTKQRYKNKFTKLWNIEMTGAVICFGMATWIIIDFDTFDTPFYIGCAIVTLLFNLLLPIVILRYISNVKNMSLGETSYKEIIKKFEKNKARLLGAQQFSSVIGVFIFFISIPVFSKLFGNDISFETMKMSQYIFIAVGFASVALFMRWGIKKYKGIMANAEKLLGELEE